MGKAKTIPKYKLMFSKERDQEWGWLKIFKYGVEILRFKTRSGQKWDQFNFWDRGTSPIPPSNTIQGKYEVNLNYYCPGDTSAMGDVFYSISPDPIKSRDGKYIRQEIGIHSDENYETKPGSAGCIVMLPITFEGFHSVLQAIKKQEKTDQLPMEVIYY